MAVREPAVASCAGSMFRSIVAGVAPLVLLRLSHDSLLLAAQLSAVEPLLLSVSCCASGAVPPCSAPKVKLLRLSNISGLSVRISVMLTRVDLPVTRSLKISADVCVPSPLEPTLAVKL